MRKQHSLKRLFLILNIVAITFPMIVFGSVSYFISTSILTDKISHSSLDTLVQLGEHMETITTRIHEDSLFLFQQPELLQLYECPDKNTDSFTSLKNSMEYTMSQLCTPKSYLSSIHIELLNGTRLSCSSDGTSIGNANAETFTQEEKEILRSRNGGIVWRFERIGGENQWAITCSRYLKNMRDQVTGIGYMRMRIQEKALRGLYNRISNLENGRIYLVDEKNVVISTNDASYYGKNVSEAGLQPDLLKAPAFTRTTVVGKSSLVTCYRFEEVPWKLIGTVPMKDLLKDNALIAVMTLSGVIFGVCFGAVITLILRRRIFDRLIQLEVAMETLDGEDFSKKAPLKGTDDEIDGLARSFNRMSDRISQAMDELYYSKIERQRAELAVIHAQINPHFLYNALDTIYWQCSIENAVEASKLVLALSKLFRMSLSAGDGTCLLSEEVECVKSYLQIQRTTRDGKIRFRFQCEEHLDHCRVLKMVLQPLCENVIQHAFTQKTEGGTAVVTIRKDGGDLLYRIEDDGDGADEEYVAYLMEEGEGKEGFVLRNINNRLRLTYGPGYHLDFHSAIGQGTVVEIRQPFRPSGDPAEQQGGGDESGRA